jgi:hypothetical protein
MRTCSAITGAGERCRAIAISGSEYCHAHHPDRAEQRHHAAKVAGKRGGRGRAANHNKELAAIKERLQEIIDGVLSGRIHTSKGNTAAALYHVLLRCVETELAVQERLELVGRMEELERLLDDRKESRWGA